VDVLVLRALDQPSLGQPSEQTGACVVVVEQVRPSVIEQVVAEQQQPDVEECTGLRAVGDLRAGGGAGVGSNVRQHGRQVVFGHQLLPASTRAGPPA
jgi:hypothetical protein